MESQICKFVQGGYKIIQTCYLCPCLTLNFILIFKLFNRLPQRLGFPACLFLLNLFSFPNSLPPYPSFVSAPFSSSCFTFSFQPFPPSDPEGLCDLTLQLFYMGLCNSLWPVPQQDAFTFSEAITREIYVLDIQFQIVNEKVTNHLSSLLKEMFHWVRIRTLP